MGCVYGSKARSEVVALSVVEPPDFSSSVDEVQEYFEEGEKQCNIILGKVCCSAEKKCPKFRTETLRGHAAESIVTYTYENNVDLIVVGTHGVGGLRGFFHTSVTTKIINYSTIPVVVIKE